VTESPRPGPHVSLFGEPGVHSDEGPIALSPFQMAFTCIVFAKGQVSRPELVRLLWGKDIDSRTRHQVRQLMHATRRKAGFDLFEVEGERISAAASVGSDVREMRDHLAAGRLLEAARIVAGGFLTGEGLGICDEFEDWTTRFDYATQSELRKAIGSAFVTRSGRSDWRGARDAAEARYVLDPRDVSTTTRVIEARAQVGRLQSAEVAFAEHVEARGRAGPEPGPIEAIERARASMPEQRGGTLPERAPFVGRIDVLGTLNSVVAEVRKGTSCYALVVGEAGIGKSRVLDEIARHATLAGVRSLTARPVELERRISLNPLLDALSGVDVEEHLAQLGEPWRTVVGATMPPGSLAEPVGAPPPIDEKSLPRRLMDAFALLLESVAREQPTILFIDDLHWADATTIAVLHFFRRRWSGVPLGVIATLRPEEITAGDPLNAWLRDEAKYPLLRVTLGELEAHESRELLEHLAKDRTIDAAASGKLLALGAAHPLYLTEVTRDYLAGRLVLPKSQAEALALPVSLREILSARWTQCSENAVRCAQMLAVASRRMRVGELSEALGVALDDVVDAVEELRHRRLCDADRDRVSITHDLFKSAIYAELGDVRRALLHRQLAEYLSRGGGVDTAGELGVHFDRAGEHALAARHASAAGARAMMQGAVAEAAHFYELVAGNAVDAPTVADATGKYATALYLGRDMQRAASALELAASRLRTSGESDQARRMDIRRVDALEESGGNPVDELVARLATIKDEARQSTDWEAVAFALDAELRLTLLDERFQAARQVCKECSRLLTLGDRSAQVAAHSALAIGHLIDRPESALESARTATRLTETDSANQRLRVLNRALIVFHHQGRIPTEEARMLIKEAAALSRTSGDLLQRFSFESNLGVSHLDAGDLDHAESQFTMAESLLGDADMTFPRINLACNKGELALAMGDLGAAKASFESAKQHAGGATPRYTSEIVSAGLGLCAVETGMLSRARQYEESLNPHPQLWYHDPYLIVAFRARLFERRGQTGRAADILASAADGVRGRLIPSWLKIQLSLAKLLLRQGSPEVITAAELGEAVAKSGLFRTRSLAFRRILERAKDPYRR